MFLTFDRVTKFYGPVIGVNNISCRIGPGITGLFGVNGAGKSTLMKLASGQLRPSLGSVRLGSHRAWSTAAKRHLGYCPDINSFYEEMTGREFVYAMTCLYGYSRVESRRRTDEVLEQVGMSDRAHRRIAGCSHGMRQRIKLAQAMVNDPEILLLDEPMSGIDPGGRHEIGELLAGLAARGKTILVSTHVLVEVEQLADSILVISRGRILASGTLSEIRALLADQPFTVEIVSPEARRAAALVVEMPDVHSVEVVDNRLTVRTRNPTRFFSDVSDLVLKHGVEVQQFTTIDASADAVFSYLQPRSS